MNSWLHDLHTLHPWEIDLILWLQNQPYYFTHPMRWISELGHAPAMVLLIIAGSWGWREQWGMRLAQFLSLSGTSMYLLKDLFKAPRPFWIHPDIQSLGTAGGFGLPSGHAMMACVWVIIAIHTRHPGWKAWAIVIIAATGVSRVTLGVHSPVQVVLGWSVGALLLLWTYGSTLNAPKRDHTQAVFDKKVLGTTFFMACACYLVYSQTAEWLPPAEWKSILMQKDLGEEVLPIPSPEGCIAYMSLYIGLAFWQWVRLICLPGLCLEGSLKQRFGRVILGVMVGALGYYLHRTVLRSGPEVMHPNAMILATGGFLGSFLLVLGFPYFFTKVGMASKRFHCIK
ncbi:phosphatase PAP2 family protein [Verrucomicrobia bacterium]|nr:phosphatase PAP2 family protein [Verrucomicrobiota bacterium]MDC0267979.1 phosphatase PAP2 family protein [bacterium]